MLKQSLLVGLSIMCLAATCDKKTEVPIDIPTKIPVKIRISSSSGTVSGNSIYNVDSVSAEFAKYKNNIGDVTVKKITYKVLNSSGADGQNINLTFKVTDPADSSQIKVLGRVSNFNVKQHVGVEKEFVLDEASKTYIVGLLKKTPPAYRVVYFGNSNTAPTNFQMEVVFDVTFKPKV